MKATQEAVKNIAKYMHKMMTEKLKLIPSIKGSASLKYWPRLVLANKMYLAQEYCAVNRTMELPASIKVTAKPIAILLLLKIVEIIKANDAIINKVTKLSP